MQLIPFSQLSAHQLSAMIALYRREFETPWEWEVEQFAALAGDGGARYWAQAAIIDGAAAGFAVVNYLPGGNFWYLNYFAVDARRRSRGIGSFILQALLPVGEAQAREHGQTGCRGTIIEAETVDGPPTGADRDQRRRRMAFYARNGAIATGARYPRPPDSPAEMPDWDVLVIPGAAWTGPLDGASRRAIVTAMCAEGYGMDLEEPWLKAYIAAC